MRIVVLCGLPGVGKLAVARELARLRGYRIFHNHLVFDAVEALFDFGSPAFVQLRERLWLALLSRAARERIGDVVFTIARDDAVDAEFLLRLAATLARAGADVRCIELTCDTAEHERRLVAADRSQFGKIASVESFRKLRASGAFPRFALPAGAATIDVTDMSPTAAAAAVEALAMWVER